MLYPVELRAQASPNLYCLSISLSPQPGLNACLLALEIGRGREIRTPDILLPKQARYQTALYPECQLLMLQRIA